MKYFDSLLKKIPKSWREHIVSALNTMVSAMIVELILQLSLHQDELLSNAGKGVAIAILAAAVRAGWKAGIALLVSWTKTRQTA